MAWPLEVFSAPRYWQVYGGAYGAPWYGRTYNIALEPFSSLQRTVVDAIRDGSSRILAPREGIEARFLAVAYAGMKGVKHITLEGEVFPGQ
jgi:hypothetical protein